MFLILFVINRFICLNLLYSHGVRGGHGQPTGYDCTNARRQHFSPGPGEAQLQAMQYNDSTGSLPTLHRIMDEIILFGATPRTSHVVMITGPGKRVPGETHSADQRPEKNKKLGRRPERKDHGNNRTHYRRNSACHGRLRRRHCHGRGPQDSHPPPDVSAGMALRHIPGAHAHPRLGF